MNKEQTKKSYEEQKQQNELITKYFENWLKNYTDKIIIQIMEKKEEILNNPLTMDLLKRLYEKETEENKEFNIAIYRMLYEDNIGEEKIWLEHYKEYGSKPKYKSSDSYREVLYDLFIEDLAY